MALCPGLAALLASAESAAGAPQRCAESGCGEHGGWRAGARGGRHAVGSHGAQAGGNGALPKSSLRARFDVLRSNVSSSCCCARATPLRNQRESLGSEFL